MIFATKTGIHGHGRFRFQIAAAVLLLAMSLWPATASAQPVSIKRFAAEAAAAPSPTLVERYGPDEIRSGSLRLPARHGPFPVAVLIHGGCWTKRFSGRRDMEAVSAALAARGIAVWNIEYRQIGDADGGYPGTYEDIAQATEHLRKLARRYPLDLKRVAIIGHSTGAPLALWVAARGRLGRAWSKPIQVHPLSVVAIDGPPSIEAFAPDEQAFCGSAVGAAFMGSTLAAQPDRYAFASAAKHLPLGTHQLLIEGALTHVIDPYARAAREAGDTVTTLERPSADHFALATPSTADGSAAIDFIALHAFFRRQMDSRLSGASAVARH